MSIINKLILETFENKDPSPPKLFITYGPPGSGKSNILKKLLKDFSISDNELIEILVDDIIEKVPEYIENVQRIIKEKLDEEEENIKISNNYFEFRKNYGDIISDGILYRALSKKYNIVWETTGFSIDYSLKTIYEARMNGYLIFLIYPFVDEEQLKIRIRKRASSSKNPRLPSNKIIEETVKKAQNNFNIITKYVDKAFIYDNTGKDLNDIYLFITIENKYIGNCNGKDLKFCSNGIEKKVTCDKKDLNKLTKMFIKDFSEYIKDICE
jgi:predicted ABC-type ATPase